MKGTKKVGMEWFHFKGVCDKLSYKLRSYIQNKNGRVSAVVALVRGGTIPAALIARAFHCENLILWNVKEEVLDSEHEKILKKLMCELKKDNSYVVVVDDILDSGNTYTRVGDFLFSLNDTLRQRILFGAVLRRKSTKMNFGRVWLPKFFYGERIYHENYVVFPWEKFHEKI